MVLFHENTDTAEFDHFMRNIPRESISVCGKTYRCQSTGTGEVYWSSDPNGTNGRSSRDCNVDMLVAAAHANNCNVSRQHKSVPADCLRENPILADGEGAAVQVRDAATYDMPSMVEAHWKCVPSGTVNENTHDPTHVEDHGGVALLRLSKEVTPRLTASAPAPSFSTPAPAPSVSEPSRAWTTCNMRSHEQKRACSVDSDCPIADSKLNEMLLAKTRELNIDMSKGLKHFVQALQTTLSSDLEWTPARAKALEGSSRTEAGVKSSVKTLLDTDATFRDSVRTMIQDDPDFSALRESARTGSCTTQGKCASATVVPTTRLYDGTIPVSFSLLDDRVVYTRNGVVREAEAIRCADTQKCDLVSEVVEGGDSISLAGRPLAAAYRLRFAGADSEYMVMNNVAARNDAECGVRLCEHNADVCPSSMCSLTDDGTCVPRR